ncbi:MAG: CPBP family intramembrane metalloprotease [Cyanobacteria bacterium J069]|nr:MAG: CPBP family intramembrane metalloprotease [Cyanobacteria bacterium J069]
MGITALVLLIIARFWLAFDSVALLPLELSLSAVAIGASLALGISVASEIAYRFWPAYRTSADTYLAMVLTPLLWIDLIWLGLLPGLSEELLFRGVMLPAIGLNSFGLVISSLCFGVLHYSGSQQWAYVIWATVVGAVLGASALATGNLLVPIVAHVMTNLISSGTWKLKQVRG